MNTDELTAEPTRLELLERVIAATGEHQQTLARLFCVTVQRDALAQGLGLLKLECANEEWSNGLIPTRVVRTVVDETIRQACEQEAHAAERIVAGACDVRPVKT
jgi:hypothetical protein